MIRISAAESQVMTALWDASPLGVEEIVARVGPANGWGDATVKTLINRLLKKRALVSERTEGRTRYRPLISRADYVTEESQGLLDRLFGGELIPLVTHMAKRRPLSEEERARLRRLIEDLDEEEI